MVGLGTAMILLSIVGLYLWKKDRLDRSNRYLKLLVLAISFPFLANTFGWIMTEVGRQPWTVTGLMTTADSISPNVSAGSILLSIILYALIFTVLAIVMVYLMIREIKKGPEANQKQGNANVNIDPFSKVGA